MMASSRWQKCKKPQPARRREGMNAAYLDAIRQLSCCACGAPAPSDAHHLKAGTGERGMGLRATDRFAVPLCRGPEGCHTGARGVESVGSRNEADWFAERGVKPLVLAGRLWASWRISRSVAELKAVMALHLFGEGQE
jgi:hypothetical protein